MQRKRSGEQLNAWLRFRESNGFLWTLCVFVGLWMFFHWLFGFDPGLGGYNSLLSTEASIVLTLVQRMVHKLDQAREIAERRWREQEAKWEMERQQREAESRKMLEAVLHIAEAIQDHLDVESA